jgi:FixJ family two-component response regulator
MTEASLIVHIVDDDFSFLSAISRLLSANDFAVRTFSSGAEFLSQIDGCASGCVIADLQMPGISGLDLQEALIRSGKVLPVIILTSKGDIPNSVHAMRNGAEDFLEKHAPKETILAAVRRSLDRASREISAKVRQREMRARFDGLSVREMEVLGQIIRGKLNKQVASELGITERTVKFHRAAITAKLKAPSVAELTRLAQESGLFDKAQLS